MHAGRLLVGVWGAAPVFTTVAGQAPIGEMDMHISAEAAAGLEYRATFVNPADAGAMAQAS
jgi:hypothetical protein